MLLVGLTGGIGSGKSTVSKMLAARGAVILDADAFARGALNPGSPQSDAVAARFGPAALGPDGKLDRRALASIVFTDDAARHDLEAMVHPVVLGKIAEGIAAHVDTDDVVVIESPLLVETGTDEACDVVVVVVAEPRTQLERMLERGMDEADAKARMSVQASIEQRASAADFFLDNEGSQDRLEEQVGRLWSALADRAAAKG